MTYEFEGKNEKEAIEKAVAELGLERDQFDVEIIETQKKSLFKAGYVKIRVHTVSDTTVSKSSEPVENTRRSYANPLAQMNLNRNFWTLFLKQLQKWAMK